MDNPRNIIQLRHGNSIPGTGDLEQYELGFNDQNDSLYIKNGENQIINLNSYPVTKVNNKTGDVTLSASDVGALSTNGGTINGSLTLSGTGCRFIMSDTDTNSSLAIYKNAGVSGDVLKDYGTQLQDFSAVDSLRDALILCRNEELPKKIRLIVRKDDDTGDTTYYLYGTHNKPTYSDVGAAPAGYGLGNAKLISVDEIDTTVAPGFYCISGTMTVNNITANYWYMIVGAYGSGTKHCVQKLYPVTSYKTELVRFFQSEVAGEWECGTPPMILGVEYRTTERYNGKPVYVKLVNFGELPNSSAKYVNINNSGTIANVIDCKAIIKSTSTGDVYTTDIAEVDDCYAASYGQVAIRTNASIAGGATASVLVKYTLA